MQKLLNLLLAAAVLAVAPLAFAAVSEDNERVLAALESARIDAVAYQDLALDEAVKGLVKSAGVSVVYDTKNLKPAEHKVSIELANLSVRNALELLLDQKGLAWQARNGVVWISTKAAIAEQPDIQTVIYDVRDITMTIQDFVAPDMDLRGSDTVDPRIAPDTDPNADKEETSLEDIIEIIREQIEPELWDKNGFALSDAKGQLVVSATPEVHKKISTLLDDLRASR